MSLVNIVVILAAITNIILGFFIYLKNRKDIKNIFLAMFVFAISGWSFTLTLLIVTGNVAWGRGTFLFSALSYIFYVLFIAEFLKRLFEINKIVKWIILIFGILVVVISPTDLIEVTSSKLDNTEYGVNIELGVAYPFVVLYYLIAFLYTVHLMIRGYIKSAGLTKLQMKYLFLGLILFACAALTTNLILPFFNIFQFNGLGPFFSVIMIASMTYAITRYRLMDIRLIIARTIAFGSIVAILVALFSALATLLALFATQAFGKALDQTTSTLIVGIIISILVVAGYTSVRKLVEKITNKFLFKKSYNPDELLGKVSDAASSILDLQKLLKTFSKILGDAMQFEKIGFAFITPKGDLKITYKEGFKPGVAEKLASYPNVVSSFVKELERDPKMLVIDEMYIQYENGEYKPVDPILLKVIHENNIAIIIPLRSKDDLIGLVVLGAKKSGDQYSHQDITTLDIFAGQATVAIENARLYDELKYFNIKLEEEVQAKTAELRSANVQLKRLDQAKSDFISIASHQLRTPLTIIKGYISMIQEGSFGKVPKKIDDSLGKVFLSNERLIALVENLLDISRIESGRQKFEWVKVDFVELAQRLTENMVGNAKAQGLKLTFIKPKEKIPQIVGEYNKLHDVIINFIDNAIKYTSKGKIDVSVEIKPAGMLTFCVKDTGRGIDPEVLAHLFQKFSRGKGSFQVNTGGSGLGLYVARMVVQAHEGKIWAESQGRDKGASFCFSIPIAGPKDRKDLPYAQPGQKVTDPVKSSARGVPKIPEKQKSKK